MRGCIDLNTINPYLQYEHFKMEGLHTIQAQLRRRDHMWKIDMSDFYMHLLIAEEDRLVHSSGIGCVRTLMCQGPAIFFQ